jgi:hypothetical protein
VTLDQLAYAMRGMPRYAPVLVATEHGLCPIVMVRGGPLKREGGGEAVYSITPELGEPISQRRSDS